MAKSDAQVKFVIGNTNIDGRSQTFCFLPAAQKEFQEHSKALSSNTLYHILSKIISETSISWSHLNPRQASFGNMGPAFCNFSLPQKVLRIRELPLWQIGIAMITVWHSTIVKVIYGAIGVTFHKRWKCLLRLTCYMLHVTCYKSESDIYGAIDVTSKHLKGRSVPRVSDVFGSQGILSFSCF